MNTYKSKQINKKIVKFSLILFLLLSLLGEFGRITIFGKQMPITDLVIPALCSILLLFNYKFFENRERIGYLNIFLSLSIFSLFLAAIFLPFQEIITGGMFLVRLFFYCQISQITLRYFTDLKDEKLYHSEIKFFSYTILGIATTISIIGFIQLIILPDLKEIAESYQYDPHINRLVGSWLDPNFTGGFLAMITCFFTPLIWEKNNLIIDKRIINFCLLIILSAIFLTYSRSAYLALTIPMFFVCLKESKKTIIIAFFIAVLAINFSERSKQRISELSTSISSVLSFSYENPDPTARLRISNWIETLNLTSQSPIFGHGYNVLAYKKYEQGQVASTSIHSASGSDSSLLTILATTGIAGLSAFLLIFFKIIKTIFRTNQSTNQQKKTKIHIGYLSALASIFIHSIFVNSLLFPPIMIFFWLITGIIYSTFKRSH